MPRNGSGVYSKPAGTTAVPNTKIESAKFNAVVDDFVQDANAARPIVAGGTGASSAAAARENLGVKIGTDVQAFDADTAKTDVSQAWTATQIMPSPVFVGSGQNAIIRSEAPNAGPAYLRFQGSSGNALGYVGLIGSPDSTLGLIRNTAGTIRIDSTGGTIDVRGLLSGDTGGFSFGTFSASGSNAGKDLNLTTIANMRSSTTLSSSATHQQFANPNGYVGSIVTSASSTAFNTTSDETLKDFIGEYEAAEAIAIIRADPVRKFTWKATGEEAVGWGAQTSFAVSEDLASRGGWVDPVIGQDWEGDESHTRYVDPRTNEPWDREDLVFWLDPETGADWVEGGRRWVHPVTRAPWVEGGEGWFDPEGNPVADEDLDTHPNFMRMFAEEVAAVPVQAKLIEAEYHPWGVDQGKRTPYLWAALSWAIDKIDELESRLAALEA